MASCATRLSEVLAMNGMDLHDDVTLLENESMKSMIRQESASMLSAEEYRDASSVESKDESKRENATLLMTDRNQSFGSIFVLSMTTGSFAAALSVLS